MMVSEVSLTTASGTAQIRASISWEDVDKPPFSLFFETPSELQDALEATPNALLIACLLPAWQAGERRVRIEGALCPRLHADLQVALATLRMWHRNSPPPPLVEPTEGFQVSYPSRSRGLSLFSCGVDSLATLRWNKLHYPQDHPAAIKGVLPVIFGQVPNAPRADWGSALREELAGAYAVALDAQVEVLPIRTNLWWLVKDGYFYDEKWHGAFLTACAHLFCRGFNLAYIASSYEPGTLHPWGSHPMMDNYYTASNFRVEHHGMSMSRMQKVSLVAQWPAGLSNLRVCQRRNGSSWSHNCGSCEKCIRTMTALVALGRLKDCDAFPQHDVSVELIETLHDCNMIRSTEQANWYRELVPLLHTRGRSELARAVEACALVDEGHSDT